MGPMHYDSKTGEWKFRSYVQDQIDHIKEHEQLFRETYEWDDVESYFREYLNDENPALYLNLCSDMEIEPREIHDLRDSFVRAVNPDGTIQLGFADPHLPYGDRPMDVVVVDRKQALRLVAEIAASV